jgi:hypothetical protein
VRWRSGIVVGAIALGCAPSLAVGAFRRSGYALRPDRGIGPVWLGERKSRVERALGHRTGVCPGGPGSECRRTYDSPRGNLTVGYIASQVTDIGSDSGQIRLGGIPLRRGPKDLHSRLRGWRHFRCEGLRIYEHGGQPSTSIYFGYGQVQIGVSTQGQGGCGGQ